MSPRAGWYPTGAQIRALLIGALLVAIATLTPGHTAVAASAPGPVTSVVGTAQNAGVALTWEGPTSTGITGYRVQYSTNNGSSWTTLSASPKSAQYTVTNLMNGRGYVFQVRAVNRIGNGPWSAPSEPVTPTATPSSRPGPVVAQRIAVPSYIYPGAEWTRLGEAAPTVGLAIINPASGPGTAKDPAYAQQVRSSRAKGLTVIGYVHTSYTMRSAAEVRAEIDRYYKFYGSDGLSGIFLDEVTSSCATADLYKADYYLALHTYIKKKKSGAKVVLNPGTKAGECYMAAGDIIITFEGEDENYVGWQSSDWEYGYDPNRFWHLVYGTDQSNLAKVIALSKTRNVGWVYVTPDDASEYNPWDTLPGDLYWNEELALANAGAEPASG